ncbi:MAG TPA: glycosyltransferase family 39 protein, partial [Solirubrobacteraceae bacterium]|nr:glycosyltransferase family 39 protein [Solirubrobacteraceae bacterium]
MHRQGVFPVAATVPHAGPRPARTSEQPERNRWLAAARDRWPLIALLLLAAGLRFGTIAHQSFWYDEAFTAVHVLHPGLGATLHGVLHTESTPPLYYVLAWVWTRVLGDGPVALRSLSTLAGLGLVIVAWAVGNTLRGRRTAIWLAALAATSPLLVWYSQEARAYELFALLAAVSFWFFVRARMAPEARPRDLWAWAAFSVLALLTFYFAAFLVAAEAVLLLAGPNVSPDARRRHLPAAGAVFVAALALIPLVVT